MTTIDFDSRKPARASAGVMVQPYSNARYATLYAHRPMLNSDGKPWKPIGSVLNPRAPVEDFAYMRQMAMQGFFPWEPDAEPDLSFYPNQTKQDIDQRKEVLKAWEHYREKREADEPGEVNTDISSEGNITVSEPKVELPEPVTEADLASKHVCEVCGYSVDNPKSERDGANRLRLHMKRHAKVATA